MKKYMLVPTLLLIISLAILSACSVLPPGGDAAGGTIFRVPIDGSIFAEGISLKFRLWPAEQLEIMEKTANCTVSYNAASGVEEIHCPDGVIYQAVTPEEFIIPLKDISDFAVIKSSQVRVGEKYRLQISGLSSDNCNNASASIETVAKQSDITIEDLFWASTMMACP